MKKSIIIIVGLVLVGLFYSDSFAENRYCNSCFKEINGQWLVVDGNNYHPEHFTCANCKGPIVSKDFYAKNSKYYDSTCFANFIAKKCEYCGKPIIGEAIYLKSKTYHKECYENDAGMRCVVCNDVVSMEFFIDSKGNAVCKNHQKIALSCFSCQRFMSPDVSVDGKEYDDGRVMCTECMVTAVHNVDDAEKLIKEVNWSLEASGIVIDYEYDLDFVSLPELNKSFDKKMIDHLGITQFEKKEYLGGLFTSKKYDIRVLYGLPKAQLREVLAHELMHVWLFRNAPHPQDAQLCEGSCQYAAYLVMQYDTTSEGEYFLEQLMNQDDSVYGLGYQNVSAYVKKNGVDKWLEYLKGNTKSPW